MDPAPANPPPGIALKYAPDQPRVSPGNSDGGQWTDGGGGGGTPSGGGASDGSGGGSRVSSSDSDAGPVLSDANPDDFSKPGTQTANSRNIPSRPTVMIGGRPVEVEPNVAFRLSNLAGNAQSAIREVQRFEPNWRPSTTVSPNTAEGEVARYQSQAREAQVRLQEIARRTGIGGNNPQADPVTPAIRPPPPRLGNSVFEPRIGDYVYHDAYRAVTGMPELAGRVASGKEEGTVAVTVIEGQRVFGVNSKASGYIAEDQDAANKMLDSLVRDYPNVMAPRNSGRFPNDGVFHAETNVLLRASKASGGNLYGKKLTVYVDRELCGRCRVVLPLVARKLGSPTVVFSDPKGKTLTMRNGKWDK